MKKLMILLFHLVVLTQLNKILFQIIIFKIMNLMKIIIIKDKLRIFLLNKNYKW